MKVFILALGSRGDVQPYIALGEGLAASGHRVTLLAFRDFADLIVERGLGFADLGAAAEAIVQSEQRLYERGNLVSILSQMGRSARELSRQAATVGLAACQGSDLIVAGLGGLFTGLGLSEKLGIPLVQAHLLPFTPTQEFPSVLTPPLPAPLSRWVNSPSHVLARQMLWQAIRAADEDSRAHVLRIPRAPFWGPYFALDRSDQPVLYGYSPSVLPRPKDWPVSVHVTGYWFLDPPQGWQPPPDLIAFLEAGTPPVYIGFGSMPSSRPEETADLVLKALKRAGQRGVLFAGWGGMSKGDVPATVHMVAAIPHTWLFPRMAAVVHHGGAGTTAAGLASGVPSIVTPFFGDQPFWARRVHALGVGPRPIPRRRLTAEGLAEAIGRAVSDAEMRRRAADLGERIRAENGVVRSAEILERGG